MTNYEITFIYDPKFKKETLKGFLVQFFDDQYHIEELKKLRPAYKIKGHSQVKYYVINVKTDAKTIKEFQRKATFEKAILRFLVINVDKKTNIHPNLSTHKNTKMLLKFLLRKSNERNLLSQEEDEQENQEDTQNILVEELVEPESSIKTWQQELKEIKFAEILEEQLHLHLEKGREFSAKEFFKGLGFKEEEIPKNVDKLVEDMEKNAKDYVSKHFEENK